MNYKITIEQVRQVRGIKPKEWVVISKDADGKCAYGHTPEVETVRMENRTVLEQTVDDLDIVAVIKAINGI